MSAQPHLIGGPYLPPAGLHRRQKITCEVRGEVICGGYAETGPIGPWPCVLKTGRASLVVTPELAHAVRIESAKAIAYWWGVGIVTVWSWRKALGVERMTPGTAELYRAIMPDKLPEAVTARGRKAAGRPENIAKMAAAKRGKPAPPATRKALIAAAKRPKPPGWGKRANQWMQAAKGLRQPTNTPKG